MANNAQVTTRSSVQRSLSALVLRDFKKGLRVVLQQLVAHIAKARVMATLALKHYLTTLQEVQPLTPSQTILARMYMPVVTDTMLINYGHREIFDQSGSNLHENITFYSLMIGKID